MPRANVGSPAESGRAARERERERERDGEYVDLQMFTSCFKSSALE
jgi:hypothetical protein